MELPVKLTEQTVQFGCARAFAADKWREGEREKQFPAFEVLPEEQQNTKYHMAVGPCLRMVISKCFQ